MAWLCGGDIDGARAAASKVLHEVTPEFTIGGGVGQRLNLYRRPEDAEHFFVIVGIVVQRACAEPAPRTRTYRQRYSGTKWIAENKIAFQKAMNATVE